jgi:O-antigen/teichoic acid export membrane protein
LRSLRFFFATLAVKCITNLILDNFLLNILVQRLILNTVVARTASTFLNFFIALLIARHCGPAIKGEVTLLITTIWFFIFFSNILGGQALVYLIPRNKIEMLVIPAYIWSVVVALIGFILIKSAHLIYAKHIPSIIALGWLSSIIGIHQTILLGRKQISNANLVQLIPLLFQLAGILFCFYFLKINDAYAFIYASLAGFAFTALASFLFIRKMVRFSGFLKDFSFREMKTPFKYGLRYQLAEVLQLFNLRYYFYPLGLQQGSQYLGVYSIGISILEAVWIIPRSIFAVHYVVTSNANNAEIKEEVNRTIKLIKASFVICALILLVIGLVPSKVYALVFGHGFSDVKHSIRFLFPGILIYTLPIIIGGFYLGLGKYKQLIVSSLSGFITLVILSWFLIPKYVMSGAALSATISFTITSLVLFVWFMVDNKLPLSEFIISKADWIEVKNLIKKARRFDSPSQRVIKSIS